MTEIKQNGASDTVGGSKFLYEQPELLSIEDHGALGFTPQDNPFEYVKTIRAVPLTMVEIGSAQRHYPVIFSRMEDPVPLAILGLSEDVNLFVDDNGEWESMCYLPSYLRCYPFTFTKAQDGSLAVVVDRAAASVTENPQYPFFVDGEISEHTKSLMEFCAQYERERKRTKDFCDKLLELELLAPQRTTYTPDGSTEPQTLADYVGIDIKKLNSLESDVIWDLHSNGHLAPSYLQLYSVENWRYLKTRQLQREGS